MNTDTLTSPGIGILDPKFADLGGCIIDILGLSGIRVTAQIAASRMFKGWVAGFEPPGPGLPPGVPPWKVVADTSFDGAGLVAALGGGVAKANIRVTLYDGDSGSPNPVYVAMFGSGSFPFLRATSQPGNYDFDGGNNLGLGFENAAGVPVICGPMGGATTYRLDASAATIGTFTGFPGCLALTHPDYAANPHPPEYMLPVQPGVSAGIWPVTGWIAVPGTALGALFSVLGTGHLKVGVNDPLSSGDQYYDFTQGLAGDVVEIPFTPPAHVSSVLDLWVWRELARFTDIEEPLAFPPGYAKALIWELMAEMYTEYPAAAAKYDFEELQAEVKANLEDLENLNESNAVGMEPAI